MPAIEDVVVRSWIKLSKQGAGADIRALTRAHALRAKIEAGEIRTIEELGSSDGRNRNDARALPT